ncbi:biotin-dependent carboxyltransferase family protein [Marinoscillum sp.]|uniref:5-oxoprolinase subunit C family protein n=1 Tax=Marinoscillum sp. TaxID=2024838 RepID=UPI003BACDE19
MKGSLIFHKAGLHTSVQDMGRYGYRKYGVPLSGSMDQNSAIRANLLVGNEASAPVLEITVVGPQIEFTSDASIAIVGADLSPKLDRRVIHTNARINVLKGQVLEFGKCKYGIRAYLAIAAELQCEQVMKSHSQFHGITSGTKLTNGDVLDYTEVKMLSAPTTAIRISKKHFNTKRLEVFPGPEFNLLQKGQLKSIFDQEWIIGPNNRMGYQMTNEQMPGHTREIITTQTIPGTIQLTPAGKLLALMRDAQVTGGYPRILQLSELSINQLAQKTERSKIRFKLA